MEQVKIFYNIRGHFDEFEKEINKWLCEKGDKIKITRITPLGLHSDRISIAIFYKES